MRFPGAGGKKGRGAGGRGGAREGGAGRGDSMARGGRRALALAVAGLAVLGGASA